MKYRKEGNLITPRAFRKRRMRTPWYIWAACLQILILSIIWLIFTPIASILSK